SATSCHLTSPKTAAGLPPRTTRVHRRSAGSPTIGLECSIGCAGRSGARRTDNNSKNIQPEGHEEHEEKRLFIMSFVSPGVMFFVCSTSGYDPGLQLAAVVAPSRAVAGTSGRLEKVARLADLLGRTPPDLIEIVVGFLTGEPRQGRLGVGGALLSSLRDVP